METSAFAYAQSALVLTANLRLITRPYRPPSRAPSVFSVGFRTMFHSSGVIARSCYYGFRFPIMSESTPNRAGKRAVSGLVGSRYGYRFSPPALRFEQQRRRRNTTQSRDSGRHAFFISGSGPLPRGLKVRARFIARSVMGKLFVCRRNPRDKLGSRFESIGACDTLSSGIIALIIEFSPPPSQFSLSLSPSFSPRHAFFYHLTSPLLRPAILRRGGRRRATNYRRGGSMFDLRAR